jgi:ProQ/FINO family
MLRRAGHAPPAPQSWHRRRPPRRAQRHHSTDRAHSRARDVLQLGWYLERVLTGAWRVDLEGKPAGVVTADDERHAKAKRAGIKAKRDAGTVPEAKIGQEQAKLGKAKGVDTGARQPKGLRKNPANAPKTLTEQVVERRPRVAPGGAKMRPPGDAPSRKDLQLSDAVIPQAANRAHGPAFAPKAEPVPGPKRLSLGDLREAARRRRDTAQ